MSQKEYVADEDFFYCHKCGKELTEDNSRVVSEKTNIDKISIYCQECESDIFDTLCAENGEHIGLYLACAVIDVPCEPRLVPGIKSSKPKALWSEYLQSLKDKDKYYRDDTHVEARRFSDGETNIRRIFGREMTERTFAKYIATEQARIEQLPGTEAQRERWGEICGQNMTIKEKSAVYDRLDREYDNRRASFRGQTITPQMDDTIIKVCKWNYTIEKCIAAGNIRQASDLQKW